MPWYLRGYRPWIVLILLCAALYLPGLAALPATDRDESRFMQASRQMIETGDLVRIRFMDEARNKKPAGIHWLQSASVGVLSSTASGERWPYRLPSALGALAAVLLLFATGARLFDRRTGFLAAALLAGSFMLVFEAHIAKTDAMLLATVMAAQYALVRLFAAQRDGKAAPGWMPYFFWAALGAGLLIKGPLTPFVVGLTAIGLWVFGHWPGMWRQLKPLFGVPLMVAIAAPWFVAIIFADPEFLRESAGHDFFKKLVSFQERHGGPPGYYLIASLVTFAPASVFMGLALWWAWLRRREREIALCLLWLIPFWIVLEIVPTKLPHYILPAYPALALIVARAALAVEEGLLTWAQWRLARAGYAAWGMMIVGAAILAVALVNWAGGRIGWFYAFPVIVAGLAWLIVSRLWRGEVRRGLLTAAFLSPIFFIGFFQFALPRADAIWPSRHAAEAAARLYPDPKTRPPLVATGYREPSLVFRFGTSTRFADPPAIADILAGMNGKWLALVEGRERAAFESAAAARNLRPRAVETWRGFNYSQGRRVELTLYAPPSP
ncbi:MAG: glycosyltransferase family 39 protein [Rhodospirillaceae bacterium]|nr:glycosyltransferase family 39 protein [Rhodospirillaceae bacterium]